MKKTVILVDDFMSTRKVIESGLKSMGFDVLNAENGEDAKRFLDGRKIDLLITDLNMPELDGIGLARYVRSSSTYFKLPILMVTTEVRKEKKDEALDSGVTAILSKPYASDVFSNIVKKLLNI